MALDKHKLKGIVQKAAQNPQFRENSIKLLKTANQTYGVSKFLRKLPCYFIILPFFTIIFSIMGCFSGDQSTEKKPVTNV